MQQQWFKKGFGLVLVLLLITIAKSSTWQDFIAFPNQIRMVNGEFLTRPAHLPVTYGATETGTHYATLNFGSLPIKRAKVKVISPIKVIPGGQTIGIKLKSKGVMVVGYHLVHTSNGNQSPAEQAGLEVGDTILCVNGELVTDIKQIGQVALAAGKAKKSIRFTVLRGKDQLKLSLTPVLDSKDQIYRLGVYVRNTAAGVGTLTFYEPKHQKYGALGHVISDVDSGRPLLVSEGKVVRSNITSIQKGSQGDPGEKRAIFTNEDETIGNIVKNTQFGIFGKMDQLPNRGQYVHSIPVGFQEEVKEGPAKILTVVSGQKVDAFKIQIVNVSKQRNPATKGLILKVTDPRLLHLTGGIVQGMSGSPIIQNGKIIGAVTHVFVNDPTSGYGTFIEWMLQDAGVGRSADTFMGTAFFCV